MRIYISNSTADAINKIKASGLGCSISQTTNNIIFYINKNEVEHLVVMREYPNYLSYYAEINNKIFTTAFIEEIIEEIKK